VPLICYVDKNFRGDTRLIIDRANGIIEDYLADGYTLTLRQLYYQFVARDVFPDSWIDVNYNRKNSLPDDTKNTQKNYARLGGIINDARLAGLIDWESIEDRTRGVEGNSHWDTPADIIRSAAASYSIDKWATQDWRLEIWVEKEALTGIFDRVCRELDVPLLACRGYVSQSEMWRAAGRMKRWENDGFKTKILHFGDHDPSGLDMTRDIQERFQVFGAGTKIERLALNYDQVQQYNPPPNPAKATDSRFEAYQQEFGDESWELDALEPRVLVSLVQDGVFEHRDVDRWDDAVKREERGHKMLKLASAKWVSVEKFLEKK